MGQYGYEAIIKNKVAGKASTQLIATDITKANKYASDLVDALTDRTSGGWDIQVDQETGEITTTETKFAFAISSITEKLATQLLRFNFNEQEAKSEAEWNQAVAELETIKKNLAKSGKVTSSKTIAYVKPSTYPSDPNAQFISGVRKKIQLWN